MRILFLTQILPYPPDAGPRVKTWHVIRYLADNAHRVVLATFVRDEETQHLPVLEGICEQVHAVRIRRSRASDGRDWLRSQLRGRPFLVERDDKRAMRELVDELLSTGEIDMVHIDQLSMAQFVQGGMGLGGAVAARGGEVGENRSPWTVFDAHNAVWKILDRMKRTAPMAMRPLIALEARRVKKYEGELVASSDFVLTVSEEDRISLLEAASSVSHRSSGVPVVRDPQRLLTIPIAVDTDALQPTARPRGSKNILTLGTLHYPPNADGIRWFLRDIFSRVREYVPDATVTVVGKNPPRDLYSLAARFPEAVSITGYVQDLGPYLERAAVLVVPVRVGGGMRVRILEAFAWALPTVTTTIGLEGIDAVPGEHVLVADEAAEFADAVVNLLQDEVAQATLAVNGRWLAEARYDRHKVLKKLDLIYGKREHELA